VAAMIRSMDEETMKKATAITGAKLASFGLEIDEGVIYETS
jgi:hypothetical protein